MAVNPRTPPTIAPISAPSESPAPRGALAVPDAIGGALETVLAVGAVAEGGADTVDGGVASVVDGTAPGPDVDEVVKVILVDDAGTARLKLTEDAVNDGTTSDAKLRRDRSSTTGPQVPTSLFC